MASVVMFPIYICSHVVSQEVKGLYCMSFSVVVKRYDIRITYWIIHNPYFEWDIISGY